MGNETCCLLKEIHKVREVSFFRNTRADWREKCEEAYEAIRQYIIYRAELLEEDDSFSLTDTDLPREVKWVIKNFTDSMTLQLKKRLDDEGLEVEVEKTERGLSLKIKLPPIPDNLNLKRFQH